MAWIESHQDIGQHPKTYALATALNADIPTAVGVLHMMWHLTLKFAWRDGDLSKFNAVFIAQSIGYRGQPIDLIQALQKTGWLDDMVVHDWLEYAGKIVRDRLYNEERRNTASNDVLPRKITATVPDRTVPNPTKPTPESPAPALPDAPRGGLPFQDFLKAWNGNCGALPRISALTDKRKAKVRQRWNDRPDMAYWLAVIRRMAKSRFMAGGSERGWVADFDWLITNDTNHVKVMEGKYDEKEHLPNGRNGSAGILHDTPLARRIRESEGLRKAGDGSTGGAVFDRFRSGPLPEKQADQSNPG